MAKVKPEIPIWAKQGLLIWHEIRDQQDIEVLKFEEAELTEANHDTRALKARFEGGEEREVKPDRVHQRLQDHGVVKDLSDIPILNDAELLKHLEVRYKKDLIYCFCGPTLIAINPYKSVPYEESEEKRHEIMQCYLEKNLKNVQPHVWAISAISFDNLFTDLQNQAICISGESGAGKTESTKRCMEFITNMKGERKSFGYVPIEQKILACNPILECFGNAKTFRNDNSSRFGKYTVLYVDKAKKNVKGASVENYLLEKSRVVKLGKEERNYHIFYAICRFMEPALQKKYQVVNDDHKVSMEKYRYLNQSGVYTVAKINDKEFYEDVVKSFADLDFSESQQDAVWKMLSTILQLGNIDVDQSNYQEGVKACSIVKGEHWAKIVSLLSINEQALEDALTNKELKVGPNVTRSPLSPAKVQNSIDSMAKELYNRIFNWIVKKLNKTLMPNNFKESDYLSIGILDIFGFEIFEKNSLEQFMINFANERLQSLYIDYIFKNECKIFEEEQLSQYTANIVYKDNRPLVLCLENPGQPPGIFELLDQTCAISRGDESFHAEIMRSLRNSGLIINPKKATQLSFAVKHTAREVEYIVEGFVEKNKDEVSTFLQKALETSQKDIVEIFFEINGLGITKEQMEEKEKATKNPKEKYLGFKFKRSMEQLISQLSACYCHFIRCIKPNEVKKSDFWDAKLSLMQIRYMGLLDSLKVRKMSYPFRFAYSKFFELYQDLDVGPNGSRSFLSLVQSNANFKELCAELLKGCEVAFTDKDLLYGTTRIFLNEKFKTDMDKALMVKQKRKKEALRTIAKLYSTKISKNNIQKYFFEAAAGIVTARDLIRSCTSKIYALQYKNYLHAIKKLQRIFKKKLSAREQGKKIQDMKQVSLFLKLHKFSQVFLYLLNAKNRVSVVQGMLQRKVLDAKSRNCRQIFADIQELAWKEIMRKIADKAVLEIQRHFRAHVLRRRNNSEADLFSKKIHEAKKDFSATQIQRVYKGYVVRKKYAQIVRAIRKIQGFFKKIWVQNYFKRMRQSVPKIQKAYQRYALRKKQINEGFRAFQQENETYFHSVAKLEHNILFSDVGAVTPEINPQDLPRLPVQADQSSSLGKSNYRLFVPEQPAIELQNKTRLVSILIDLDINVDTTNIYQNTWSTEFMNFLKRVHTKGSRLLHLEIGESFTAAITDDKEVYTWGMNDHNQCARFSPTTFSLSQNIVKNLTANPCRLLSVGKDHGLMVDESNNLYSWGKNSEGQLGLGHTRENSSINVLGYLSKEPIRAVSAKEGVNYVLTIEGKVWTWPGQTAGSTPIELPLPVGTKISSVSVGSEFAMLLGQNGLLYSVGKNRWGELGNGSVASQPIPQVVKSLKD